MMTSSRRAQDRSECSPLQSFDVVKQLQMFA